MHTHNCKGANAGKDGKKAKINQTNARQENSRHSVRGVMVVVVAVVVTDFHTEGGKEEGGNGDEAMYLFCRPLCGSADADD